jgi:YgiT-type zinc finger domain-containing protein
MMNPIENDSYDYGLCDVCESPMEERIISQSFWIQGQLIVVENIPAGVCPQCGEKVVKADIGHQVLNLIGNRELVAQAPRISVPALEFAASI